MLVSSRSDRPGDRLAHERARSWAVHELSSAYLGRGHQRRGPASVDHDHAGGAGRDTGELAPAWVVEPGLRCATVWGHADDRVRVRSGRDPATAGQRGDVR